MSTFYSTCTMIITSEALAKWTSSASLISSSYSAKEGSKVIVNTAILFSILFSTEVEP